MPISSAKLWPDLTLTRNNCLYELILDMPQIVHTMPGKYCTIMDHFRWHRNLNRLWKSLSIAEISLEYFNFPPTQWLEGPHGRWINEQQIFRPIGIKYIMHVIQSCDRIRPVDSINSMNNFDWFSIILVSLYRKFFKTVIFFVFWSRIEWSYINMHHFIVEHHESTSFQTTTTHND